jgi:hypothetical protein
MFLSRKKSMKKAICKKCILQTRINPPETLATLAILIAESEPKDKEKMIGIVLLLLNFEE